MDISTSNLPNATSVKSILVNQDIGGGVIDAGQAAPQTLATALTPYIGAGSAIGYATQADMFVDTARPLGTIGRVFDPDPTKAGEYLKTSMIGDGSGQWTKKRDETLPAVAADVAALQGLKYSVSATVNLFDPSQVTAGYEILIDGSVQSISPTTNNSAVSGLIPVAGQTYLTLSGLTASASDSYVVFLQADGVTPIPSPGYAITWLVTIPAGNTSAIISVPPTAIWARFECRKRLSSAPNLSNVQLEYGRVQTALTVFSSPAIIRALGKNTVNVLREIPSLDWLLFGDSKTATATITYNTTPGTYTENTNGFTWANYAKPLLRARSWFNYAYPGATYCDQSGRTGDLQWRNLWFQVDRAWKDGRSAQAIYISAGTNDDAGIANGLESLGDYATAMSKTSIGALDRTKFYEALRWVLWSVTAAWPRAIVFMDTPTQRGDRTPEQQAAVCAAIKQMGARYNAIVHDANAESGIVADFEVSGGVGRYLLDGLHEMNFNHRAANPSQLLDGVGLMAAYRIRKITETLRWPYPGR